MKASPIIHHEVMTTTGGKKVAYLFFNEFEWGAQQSNGTFEFENDLRKVFGEFKNAGASELVLDLRYNPGGYVHTCQILTSLIGNVSTTDVFAKSLRNDDIQEAWSAAGYSGTIDNPQIDHFVNESNSLKLSKVYILATRSSASASEMVINALRGADVDVVHIGERTNGKNVGMDLLETTIDDYSYQMRPITFKILNAKDFTDYANGFAPNHLVDELDEVLGVKDARLHEFGNPEELLLEKALGLIDPAMARSAGRAGVTRAPGERTMQPLRVLRDSRKGGAIYVQGARIE